MDNRTDSPPLISLPESEHRPLSVRAKALVFADQRVERSGRTVEQRFGREQTNLHVPHVGGIN
ncbi:putative AAA+ superfamily ATPase [Burkholderia sp. PvR073]|uniref:hypothetical protein n=1 Tax=Burkholderia TaxID=32008 RepID=UPI00254F5D6F|nr:hypothetical protein [Burkholderia sp. lyk4-R2A-23]